jgi:hypothetical protein
MSIILVIDGKKGIYNFYIYLVASTFQANEIKFT